MSELRPVVEAFRSAGGDGKSVYLQMHLSRATDDDTARGLAHDQWRTNVFPSSLYPGLRRRRAAAVGRMSAAESADLWWKNAVIYCLDVETFLDSDGDGIGDFTGLIDRVDYLAQLGVSCIWLMPFYPTAHRDDGYDITDFYAVDARLGSLGDFTEFLRTAHDRGLRVIIDLVVNHTSDRHPWFRAARSSPDSEFRDYYVWADEPQATPKQGVVFPDEEDSIWTWDERAGQFYLHHFYSHQPDLNITNPRVVDEIAKLAGFWLELGVDGFRVDAVPFLIERGGTDDSATVDPHRLLRELRALMSRRRGDAILLGEVNLPPEPLAEFFGDEDGDELHVLFNFPVMQAMYLALARRSPQPLADALSAAAHKPTDSQWATFVRSHDELTLDQLTDSARADEWAMVHLFGGDRHAATREDGWINIDLDPHGYRWLRLDAGENPLP